MTQAVSNPDVAPADGDKDAVVKKAIQSISHIATLPQVTLKIIHLVDDPESTAQDLNKVITNDPALGTRILKVVNSAFYGLPGQIGSINRAIVLLGLNAVKNIAIAASLAKLFRGGQICPQFNARDLWMHSIAVAATTRLLADHTELGLPDEAFLSGLIHDIGIMVEIQACRAQFVQAIEKLETEPNLTFREAEQQTLGACHEDFGAALCKTWKFPLSFVHVTGYHHRPLELPAQHRVLTSLVHAADIIVTKLDMGYTRTVESDQVSDRIMTELKLTAEAVKQVSGELPDAIEETKVLLSDSG